MYTLERGEGQTLAIPTFREMAPKKESTKENEMKWLVKRRHGGTRARGSLERQGVTSTSPAADESSRRDSGKLQVILHDLDKSYLCSVGEAKHQLRCMGENGS